MIENEHTRRQIGENALQVRFGGFELRLIERRGGPAPRPAVESCC